MLGTILSLNVLKENFFLSIPLTDSNSCNIIAILYFTLTLRQKGALTTSDESNFACLTNLSRRTCDGWWDCRRCRNRTESPPLEVEKLRSWPKPKLPDFWNSSRRSMMSVGFEFYNFSLFNLGSFEQNYIYF
jgi:hypothetical protein